MYRQKDYYRLTTKVLNHSRKVKECKELLKEIEEDDVRYAEEEELDEMVNKVGLKLQKLKELTKKARKRKLDLVAVNADY